MLTLRQLIETYKDQIAIDCDIEYIDIVDKLADSPIANITRDDLLDLVHSYDYEECTVIYYSSAIEYLAKYDPSLQNSLEIAMDFGYPISELNSELLATLLIRDAASTEASENTERIIGFIKNELSDENN